MATRTLVLRKPDLITAAREVLQHRAAAQRYASAMRSLRKAMRPLAEDGHQRARVGPAVIEMEWQGGRKANIPDDVRERYTEYDERARLEMRVEEAPPSRKRKAS